MLTIMLEQTDDLPQVVVNLEHSLVSLSKWESIQEKPFFGREQMDHDETLGYIKLMVLGDPPEGDWTARLKTEHYATVTGYINSKQTATWFREDPNAPKSREIVTNELIYHWMIEFGIPFKPCDEWHLNHLMTLIKVRGLKQAKPKKMTRAQQAEEYRRLNAERKARLGTTG